MLCYVLFVGSILFYSNLVQYNINERSIAFHCITFRYIKRYITFYAFILSPSHLML